MLIGGNIGAKTADRDMQRLNHYSRGVWKIFFSMQRLSQLSSQLTRRPKSIEDKVGIDGTASNSTPLQIDHGNCATVNTYPNMAKTKVVVTRQLIDEAQKLLDAKNESLEIVQWQSEKVSPRSEAASLQTANVHIYSPATDLGSCKTSKEQLEFW